MQPNYATPEQVISFWKHAGPSAWFSKSPAFDENFRSRFLREHEAAARGDLAEWILGFTSCLALLVLLDQFPRNAFRGTAHMYATDAYARSVARHAVASGFDFQVDPQLQVFFYLPFAHSEDLADQDRSVELHARVGLPYSSHAHQHREIIRRFGRFPHRNEIMGRHSTPGERAFLHSGGFRG